MIERHSKHHHIDSFFMYGLAVFSIIVLSTISKQLLYIKTHITEVVVKKIENKVLFNQSSFNNLRIQGKAYVLYDVVDGKIIASANATTSLPLASLTKVMTAVTSYNHYDKNKVITITNKSIEDGYDLGLRNGQQWKLGELLKYTLVFSSNDGAQAIADALGSRAAFVSLMNNDAKSFGLNLVFTQPAGLDEDGKIGGMGSALDVAKLFAIARKEFPEILDATTKKRVTVSASTGKVIGIPNTNQDITTIAGAEVSKTGFTTIAGGNLVVITDITIGHPVVIVVLGSTKEERFTDMQILYKALQESLQK